MITTAQKAQLEDIVEEWIGSHCEDIDVWWPDNAAEKMTAAAVSLVESWKDAQDTYEENHEQT